MLKTVNSQFLNFLNRQIVTKQCIAYKIGQTTHLYSIIKCIHFIYSITVSSSFLLENSIEDSKKLVIEKLFKIFLLKELRKKEKFLLFKEFCKKKYYLTKYLFFQFIILLCSFVSNIVVKYLKNYILKIPFGVTTQFC